MNNQECEKNNNEPSLYPYNIKINKRSGTCNSNSDPYEKLCVPDDVRNINVKVFNLMSRTNETRHIECHETYKCKCRIDVSVCDNKQGWNEDKCRCGCKELIDKGRCDKGFIWNPSNCECERDTSCDLEEYLDYKNRKCRKKIVDKLVEECSENINGNEMIYNENLNANVCNYCTIYIVLFVIFLIISISISTVFIYFHWFFKKDNIRVKFNTNNQTTIY